MEKILAETNILFHRPTFLHGFGGVIDMSGSALMYRRSPSAEIADTGAIAADWAAVSRDLNESVEKFETEQEAA